MDKLGKVTSTQEHLDIEDIRDDIVLQKNGNATAILQTTAVNFDLLSETEQDAMIFAFAALLNSLTFPIQILIRTKRLDITNYLVRVTEAKQKTRNPSLEIQIEKYESFIKELVSKNQVLDKRFYVSVPYIGIDLSQVTSDVTGLFKKRPKNFDKWSLLEKAKVNLEPKVEHLFKQFSRVGIKSIRLNTEELIELFYDLYNPDIIRGQKAALDPGEYTTPIVEPSLSPETIEEAQEASSEEVQPLVYEGTEGRPLHPSEEPMETTAPIFQPPGAPQDPEPLTQPEALPTGINQDIQNREHPAEPIDQAIQSRENLVAGGNREEETP